MTDVKQRTEGEGQVPEHTLPATEHSHDHWHVSHDHIETSATTANTDPPGTPMPTPMLR